MTSETSTATIRDVPPLVTPAPIPEIHGPLEGKPTLRKLAPYWHPFRTWAKERWYGREILEMVSTEFRDRSVEYYRFALESGVTTINGKVARPGTIIKNGDYLENMRHRHEPPIASTPVKILHRDDENGFIVVDKPGSIPVHAAGRYYHHSLTEILKSDFGIEKPYTVNRLDRLTSGCMFIATTPETARMLTNELTNRIIKKEYVARCVGEFPPEEVVVDQPMLCVDRQMGLNIVHPEGKAAKTVFNRMFYDENSNTSVVHCQPLTGRSHQIRVHLQFLGHPIANDPVYSDLKVWGPRRGRGGLPVGAEQKAPDPIVADTPIPPMDPPKNIPPSEDNLPLPSSISIALTTPATEETPTPLSEPASIVIPIGALPRENGTDIGIASPVPLSPETVSVISALRNQKDETEEYARWRDVIFRTKAALKAHGPQGVSSEIRDRVPQFVAQQRAKEKQKREGTFSKDSEAPPRPKTPPPISSKYLSSEGQMLAQQSQEQLSSSTVQNEEDSEEVPFPYCEECFIPLYPDPRPSQLYIYLHALRYTTSKWSFATEMPFWAVKGWEITED